MKKQFIEWFKKEYKENVEESEVIVTELYNEEKEEIKRVIAFYDMDEKTYYEKAGNQFKEVLRVELN